MASYIIGNAWSDENGSKAGKKGDQKQKSTPDYSGEVRQQSFYTNTKGWYIFRPISDEHANKIAERMVTACNNPNIGYSQDDRYAIIKDGIDTKKASNCDCSSLVRECIKEATGKDPGDFSTATEVAVLKKTDLFQYPVEYRAGMTLYTGDIIVTKVKGHTAVITIGDRRPVNAQRPTKTLETLVDEIIAGKYGTGDKRKKKVESEGWNYDTVRAAVNCALGAAALNKKSTSDSTNKMLVASTRTVAAKTKDKLLNGAYRITQDLNLRTGPEATGTVSIVMPKNGVCRCYGYYTKNNSTGTRWFYVCYEGIVGYASEKYLDKIKK